VEFLESLRQSADELAQRAAELGRVGAARLEELAARRRVDSLLRRLGALVYAEHVGRGTADPAEVSRLVEAVAAEEARAEAAARAAEEAAAEAARRDGHL
jgi:hypothetical protein